ncbi:uncharacterized protein LOC117911800 [Vitis riparia]|uniref:uncharacterized protein LOC117911800 n=1 Tax=Vitis riparia TaxID=96939 RepID=UPI00155ADD73|nr:uncharacterized protein LOC117911800 [Vitis riparia]XP_034682108.1 uncharacterized protein LOC117911800 [Vitis riparia]
MAPSSGGYFLWMKIVNGMSKVGKMEGYLKERCKMVRLRRTRKVLRGRGPWPRLDTILNYKRDPSHFTNEHVDHVANMFKRFEEEYILESNCRKHILQMSLTEPEKKVLENIWESIQEGPHGFTNRSFDDLVAIFKEHWEKCFVKNVIR